MKAIIGAILPMALAASAHADEQVFQISDCKLSDHMLEIGLIHLDCEVTNFSGKAIASLEFEALVKDLDRTVPWYGPSLRTEAIPGGIESGEAVQRRITVGAIPSHADRTNLEIEISPTRAFGVDGETIKPSP